MDILQNITSHERVYRVQDQSSGLHALIAIHSTALGPAAGGCRLWAYKSEDEALSDVLNLSRGMTYKNALADLGLGGGKSVILGPLAPEKRAEAFRAFGRAIKEIGGDYVTAEDVGVAVSDMELVARETSYVSGLKDRGQGIGGDPAPYTARGVVRGIQAAAAHAFGNRDLSGLRIAVQGIGSVGEKVAATLVRGGAELIVSDVDEARVERICAALGTKRANPDAVLMSGVDIVVPCALGGAITETVAAELSAKIVAGAANNQLASPEAGDILKDRGITYVPDYVINSGGIIMAAAEYHGHGTRDDVVMKVDAIYNRTIDILVQAKKENLQTATIADRMAEAVISKAKETAVA